MPRTNKVYGRFRPISSEELKSYKRTLSNPLGVTALALVNGKGSYKSARQGAKGKTKAARMRRVQRVLSRGNTMKRINVRRLHRNYEGSSVSEGPSLPGQSYGGRSGAYVVKAKTFRRLQSKLRKGTPLSDREKKQVDTYLSAKKYGLPKKRKAGKGGHARYRGPQVRKVAARTTRSVRVAFGTYRRARVLNPKTGRTELSYMYVTKGGKLRKIPTKALQKHGGLKAYGYEALKKRRARAAAQIEKHGDVFVPNRRKKASRKTRRSSMRANMARGSHHTAATKKKIARKVRASWKTRTRKTSVRKVARKSMRKVARKAPKTSRAAAARKRIRSMPRDAHGRLLPRGGVRKTSRKGTRKVSRKSMHKNAGEYFTMNGSKKRRSHKRRHHNVLALVGHQKHKSHKRMHRNGRRRSRHYTANAWMADLLATLKTGAVVGAGFLLHRLSTNLLVDYVVEPYLVSKITDATTKKYLQAGEKALTGLLVLGAGVAATSLLPKLRMELGAGMVASFIQQAIVDGLTAANQTKAAHEIAGYSNSLAYSLHGAYEHNAQSTMPVYAPVQGFGEYFPTRGVGEYTQAAAGFQQAAAGFQQAAAGTGEYFAPAGVQGIGQYEGAGEQALLPSGAPSMITDGIRPDANLDRELDLMEAAAGLHGRRGVGEYVTATRRGGGFTEAIVGQQSQWIPNGPMWAGTLEAQDSAATSEIPAGILASQGGNGTLSG